MPGALIIPTTASASAVEGYIPEIAANAQGWYRPAVDQATAIVNRIPGKPSLTPGGSNIGYAPGYATLRGTQSAGGAAHFDTGILETGTITIGAIVRSASTLDVNTNRPAIISNFISSRGLMAWLSGQGADTTGPGADVRIQANFNNAGSGVAVTRTLFFPDVVNWFGVIFVIEEGVQIGVYNPKTGESSVGAETRPRLVQTSRNFWLGNSPDGIYGSTIDMAACCIRAGAAGASERAAIYMQMVEEAAERGVVVA
jgi:hypothetical protein